MLRRGSGPWRAECQALFLARARAGALPVALDAEASGRHAATAARCGSVGSTTNRGKRRAKYSAAVSGGAVDPRLSCLTRNLPRWR